MPRTHDEEIDRRILEVAEREINERGLTGLRVSDVAEKADTTVAMVYRHFVDRDGLIAATLAAYFRSRFQNIIDLAQHVLDRPGELSIDDLVDATPPMRYAGSELVRHRMQRIYVASVENTALRLTIREIIATHLPRFEAIIRAIAERFPPDRTFDPRIFTVYVLRHNAIIDDILGDEGLSNEEYRDFLRTLITDSMDAGEPSTPLHVDASSPIDTIDVTHRAPSVLPSDRPALDPSITRILTATQAEIDDSGLVGLRVAKVAQRSGTTIAAIYRRFGDRDGLIAACLGANLDARLGEIARMPRVVIDKDGPVSIEDILAAIPPIQYEGSEIIHARRQRIYIAALEIAGLRTIVREIIGRRLPDYTAGVRQMIDRLPESERFDERILTILLLRYNFMLEDIFGPHRLSNEEFRSFLRDLMVRSARRQRRLQHAGAEAS